LKGRKHHLGDTGMNARIILKGILIKYGVNYERVSSGSGYGSVADSYEHGNKHLGTHKMRRIC
jgi:hypothetical protein